MDLWMRNKMLKEDIMIVDCGSVNEEAAQKKADALRDLGIGKQNFRIEISRRIFVNIPKSKRVAILKQFPEIVEGGGFWGSTHSL